MYTDLPMELTNLLRLLFVLCASFDEYPICRKISFQKQNLFLEIEVMAFKLQVSLLSLKCASRARELFKFSKRYSYVYDMSCR